MFALLYPGQKSALVTLQSVLKERHDNLQVATAKRIERRKARGTPLDDGDGPIEPLDDYTPVEGYDHVRVQFVALDEKRRAELVLAVALAQSTREQFTGFSLHDVGAKVLAADAEVEAAQVAFIRASVCRLEVGAEGAVDIGDDVVVAALRSTGALLTHLFVAARDYQALSPGKGSRFGSPLPSKT